MVSREFTIKTASVVLAIIIYILALAFLKPPFNLTAAAIVSGIIVGWIATSGKEGFLYGLIVGGLSIALILNIHIGLAFKIVAGVAGTTIATLVLLYHLFAPAFVALATALLIRK